MLRIMSFVAYMKQKETYLGTDNWEKEHFICLIVADSCYLHVCAKI